MSVRKYTLEKKNGSRARTWFYFDDTTHAVPKCVGKLRHAPGDRYHRNGLFVTFANIKNNFFYR